MTPQELRVVLPLMPAGRAIEITDLLNQIMPLYNITHGLQVAAFVAQLIHESGDFKRKVENLNYITAERLKQVFPKYFKTLADATKVKGKPEIIANIVYGGRMGNSEPGDGWNFRGSGFIQITGRETFAKYAKYKAQSIETVANLMRTDDEWAMDSAAWLFAIEKKLLPIARAGLIDKVSRAINGGDNGLEDRRLLYTKIKKATNVK